MQRCNVRDIQPEGTSRTRDTFVVSELQTHSIATCRRTSIELMLGIENFHQPSNHALRFQPQKMLTHRFVMRFPALNLLGDGVRVLKPPLDGGG